MSGLIDALATLGLATGVARSASVYVLVSASHILGIALLLGPILLADLRLLGLLQSLDLAGLRLLRKAARAGVAIALVTGLLLLSARPAEYATNPALWAKLAVVAAGLVNAAVFELGVYRPAEQAISSGAATGTAARLAAALSIALWLAALLLGRLIAFV